jgi:hypothetical protein
MTPTAIPDFAPADKPLFVDPAEDPRPGPDVPALDDAVSVAALLVETGDPVAAVAIQETKQGIALVKGRSATALASVKTTD